MLFHLKTLFYIEVLLVIGLLIARALASAEGRRQINPRLIAFVLLLPAIGYLLPGGRYAYMVALLILLPALSRSRVEAACLFAAGLPLMPMLNFPVKVPGPIDYLLIIGTPEILTLAFLIAFLIHRRTAHVKFNGLDAGMLLLWLCMTLVQIHGAIAITATHILRCFVGAGLMTLLPYFLLSRSLVRVEHLRLAVRALAISGLLLSVIGLFEMIKHWTLYPAMYQNIGIESPMNLMLRLRGGMLRAPGPFSESTSFAAFLSIAGLAVAQSRGLFRSRLHQLAAVALMVGGLLATSSRGGWLAFISGLLFVQLYRGKVARVAIIVALCVGTYGAVKLAGAADPRLGEFLGVSGHAVSTADYREDLVRIGLQQVRRRPILGSDQSTLVVVLHSLVQGEGIVDFVNTYLYIALYTGLVGLSFFLSNFAILAVWLGKVRSILRRSRLYHDTLTFIVAMAGSMLAVMFVQSLADRNFYWIVFIFAFGRALQTSVEFTRKSAAKQAAAVPPAAIALPA